MLNLIIGFVIAPLIGAALAYVFGTWIEREFTWHFTRRGVIVLLVFGAIVGGLIYYVDCNLWWGCSGNTCGYRWGKI